MLDDVHVSKQCTRWIVRVSPPCRPWSAAPSLEWSAKRAVTRWTLCAGECRLQLSRVNITTLSCRQPRKYTCGFVSLLDVELFPYYYWLIFFTKCVLRLYSLHMTGQVQRVKISDPYSILFHFRLRRFIDCALCHHNPDLEKSHVLATWVTYFYYSDDSIFVWAQLIKDITDYQSKNNEINIYLLTNNEEQWEKCLFDVKIYLNIKYTGCPMIQGDMSFSIDLNDH